MNIVDSSAWLEYFANGKNAKNFAKVIEDTESLLVPSIILYEVFKKIVSEKGENEGFTFIAHMKLGTVIDLDLELAVRAGKASIEYQLAMADSIILATSRKYNAIIWTQDADFKNLPNVKYFKKK